MKGNINDSEFILLLFIIIIIVVCAPSIMHHGPWGVSLQVGIYIRCHIKISIDL